MPRQERFALTIDDATNAVVGNWRGSKATIPVAKPGSGQTIREVAEATFNEVREKGTTHPGGDQPRFKLVGNAIVEQADDRPVVRFTPNSLVLDVGDPLGSVTVEVVNPDNTVDTTHNATYVVEVDESRRFLRLPIVNGVGSITVRTSRSFEIVLNNNPNFRVRRPLTIRIVETQL